MTLMAKVCRHRARQPRRHGPANHFEFRELDEGIRIIMLGAVSTSLPNRNYRVDSRIVHAFANWPRSPIAAAWRSHWQRERELRDELMPINKKWPIEELVIACREFERSLKPAERFTFEYDDAAWRQ